MCFKIFFLISSIPLPTVKSIKVSVPAFIATSAFSNSKFKSNLEENFNREITDENLKRSIKIFNKSRQLLTNLYELRKLNSPPINGSEVLNADLEACRVFGVRNNHRSINIPTLVICGEEDQMTPPRFATFLHERILNTELHIIANAGHYVFQEAAEEVNNVILNFFRITPTRLIPQPG